MKVISDNGTQFASIEFRKFSEDYNFMHITSSPNFPQGNAGAERFVQIAKTIRRQEDPQLTLMIYVTTKASPPYLVTGREMRTTLPTLERNLQFKKLDHDLLRTRDAESKNRYEHFYNQRHSTRPLSQLEPGDQVRVKIDEEKKWSEPRNGVNQAR